MTCYSIKPIDRISVKGYRYLILILVQIWVKNVSVEHSVSMLVSRQKPLDNAKQSAIDPLKTASKRAIQKAAESIAALIGNKITNKITEN